MKKQKEDQINAKLLDAKLTVEGITDSLLKAGTVGASIIITKAMLDIVKAEDWIKWLKDHPVTMEKAILFSLSPAMPLALGPFGPILIGATPDLSDLEKASKLLNEKISTTSQLIVTIAISPIVSIIPLALGKKAERPEEVDQGTKKAEELNKWALEKTKWIMAILIGILSSSTMIYAGDSIIDLISGMIKSLQIPIPM